jgi:hypothetical protein
MDCCTRPVTRKGVRSRARRVGEVAGHAHLEGPLAIRLGIPLAEPGLLELGPQGGDGGARLASGELLLERLAGRPSDRRRIDESETGWRGSDASRRGFHRVQHREEAAPRVADDGERFDVELGGDTADVGHLIAPPDDGAVVVVARAAAAALVVGDDAMVLGEVEHLREQVLVARRGTAVKEQQRWRVSGTPLGPVERDGSGRGESVGARRRDWWHRGGV